MSTCFWEVAVGIWLPGPFISPLPPSPFSSSANLNKSLPWSMMIMIVKAIMILILILMVIKMMSSVIFINIAIVVVIITIFTWFALSPPCTSSHRGDSGTRPGTKRSTKSSKLPDIKIIMTMLLMMIPILLMMMWMMWMMPMIKNWWWVSDDDYSNEGDDHVVSLMSTISMNLILHKDIIESTLLNLSSDCYQGKEMASWRWVHVGNTQATCIVDPNSNLDTA